MFIVSYVCFVKKKGKNKNLYICLFTHKDTESICKKLVSGVISWREKGQMKNEVGGRYFTVYLLIIYFEICIIYLGMLI